MSDTPPPKTVYCNGPFDVIVRSRWKMAPGTRRRHYVYDDKHSLCASKMYEVPWVESAAPKCNQCASACKDVQAHANADFALHGVWRCMCLNCRRIRG